MPDGCVVVVSDIPWWTQVDLEEPRCGALVIGERLGFPMCAKHMNLFDPDSGVGGESFGLTASDAGPLSGRADG